MTRRPYIANQRVEIAVGLVLFVASWLVLYDAWDARGQRAPLLLRPFLPV